MRILDISTPLGPGTPIFPGDPTFGSQPTHAIARGDAYNVSLLQFGSHAGTHVDPPLHFVPGGTPADQLSLTEMNGPCCVLEVAPQIRSIGAQELSSVPEGTRRLLLKTSNSARWKASESFFADYVALRAEGADWLLEHRVGLIGIDSLSIENDSTGTFPVHHRLLASSVLILEGLRLADVSPGYYELRCLPLKIVNGDGAPARVALFAP